MPTTNGLTRPHPLISSSLGRLGHGSVSPVARRGLGGQGMGRVSEPPAVGHCPTDVQGFSLFTGSRHGQRRVASADANADGHPLRRERAASREDTVTGHVTLGLLSTVLLRMAVPVFQGFMSRVRTPSPLRSPVSCSRQSDDRTDGWLSDWLSSRIACCNAQRHAASATAAHLRRDKRRPAEAGSLRSRARPALREARGAHSPIPTPNAVWPEEHDPVDPEPLRRIDARTSRSPSRGT